MITENKKPEEQVVSIIGVYSASEVEEKVYNKRDSQLRKLNTLSASGMQLEMTVLGEESVYDQPK